MKSEYSFSKIIVLIVLSSIFSAQIHSQVVLYGMTTEGGAYSQGTIFSITPTGNMQIVASMNGTNAADPYGSLVYASDGNFYGSSSQGGQNDGGAIFSCTPGGVITTIINLDSAWGGSTVFSNNLIQAKDGNLYGMAGLGGTYSYGVIYKLQLSGYYTALHFFNDTDGYLPYGSLIQASDSNLWGMTLEGGLNGIGTIFHCTPSGTFSSDYSFTDSLGAYPYGNLLLADDDNFYGLTAGGGLYGYGTLFRFTTSGTYTKLVDFNDTNGAAPFGSLIQASDGNLYGLTANGGDSANGTLFVCTLSGNLTTLVNFYDSIGEVPNSTLMQATDGNLYGMAYQGGQYNLGTVFQFTLSHIFTKLFDFDGTTGFYPEDGNLTEIKDSSTGINKIANTCVSKLYPNPNNGQFTIQSSVVSCQWSVEIYNTLGERVYLAILPQTSKWAFPKGIHSENQINLSSQPNGIYLYRIIDEYGNKISTGKFVIQN